MAELLTPELLDAYRKMRQARADERMKRFARTMGAASEAQRTGQSAVDVFEKWAPDEGQTLTGEQKIAAMSKQADRQAEISKNRADNALKQFQAEMDGLEAILRARVQEYGTSSANSRARASNALQALGNIKKELDFLESRATQLDEPTESLITEFGRAVHDMGRTGKSGDFTSWLGSIAGQQAMTNPQQGPEAVAAAATAAWGFPVSASQVQAAQNLAMGGERERRSLEGMVGQMKLASGEAGPLGTSMLESAVKNIMANTSADDSQKIHRLDILASRAGVPLEDLMSRLGMPGVLERLHAQQSEEVATIMQNKQTVLTDMLRSARAVGADTSGIEAAVKAIQEARQGYSPGEAESSRREDLQSRVGGGDVRDPAVMQQRIRDAAGDPELQSALMMEYIAAFPEDPPAQTLRKSIESAPVYQQWRKQRNYEAGPSDLVWKEFEREANAGLKQQTKRFERQVEANRQLGFGRTRDEQDTPPLQTGTDTLVAGANRRQEQLDAPERRGKR